MQKFPRQGYNLEKTSLGQVWLPVMFILVQGVYGYLPGAALAGNY